ncbi:hypothetical protein RT99_13630 [Flavobacterium sp. MEB061]|uniref:DUF5996 family protein n=1 Tax=Flavobacterium sp. MEB061 TaxID=1587524 RepID=UPI0005ACE457|nr:DUF5996 family protein [Flavobacterium sp. MEB061]KIQ20129.1 hypothetical protein RT99_13630 [Flavobacterium sp. MEB061]
MKKHWPVLSYAVGKPTYETLQLFTQIVGKIKLATMPWINHSWGVTLHLTPAGLTTQTIPYNSKYFQIDFDLNNHQLEITTSLGESKQFSLENISVAGFYQSIQKKLKEIDIEVPIFTVPSEIVDPIPFEQDESHNTYDKEHASAFHIALLRINEVFLTYRSGFKGKTSPIHFFWGGFDLSLSFFSGKKAPTHPGKMPGMPNWVLQDAFSQELLTVGFFPGNEDLNEAAFYCYLYPEPEEYSITAIQPKEAYYLKQRGEFILSYADVQMSEDPEQKLLAFLNSTYALGAKIAKWDPAFVEPITGI